MGGILSPSKEEEIKKLLRLDDSKKLEKFLLDNGITQDALYTNHNRTLLQLSCYYESPKCLSKLIEMNYNYNQPENVSGNTPLFISCKFNCLNLVKILLSKDDCKKLVKNNEDMNEFDIAFIKGNYQICYYLLYEYTCKTNNNVDYKINEINNEDKDINLKINTNSNMNLDNKIEKNYKYDKNHIYQNYFYNNNFDINYFLNLQKTNKYPLFNMPLFYKSLCKRIPPKDCDSFAPERKRTKDLMTKIPDPNETWGHFFKRLFTMELYNPPLVDKRNVSQMNSLYMSTQMKLIENEYGVKLSYYNPNLDNTNMLDDEEAPIIRIKKKNNRNKNNIEKDEEEDVDNDMEKEEENNNIEVNKKMKERYENKCSLKVKENSSERIIKDEENNNDE